MIEQEEKELTWPNKLYLLHENEMWLNEQAQKGLVLKSFIIDSANFIKTESRNIVYKVIILDDKKAENHVKLIQHQGFTFVGSYKEYYIFYIDGKYEHIIPRLNEEIIKFARKWFYRQIIKSFAGAIIVLIPAIFKLILIRKHFLQAIIGMSSIGYFIWGFIFTCMLIDGIKELRAIIRVKKYFLGREIYLSRRHFKRSHIRSTIIIAICIMSVVVGVKYIYFDKNSYSIDEVRKVMPIVLLKDIEKDQELSEKLKIDYSTVNEDNSAEIRHTLLAPNLYIACQSNGYSNYMFMQYYELSIEGLAEPLAKEFCSSDIILISEEKIKKIEVDDFDTVYIGQDGSISFISACKGKKVMYIYYRGDKKAEDVLNLMAEVL